MNYFMEKKGKESYSSLLTKPVPLGSKGLKAASMVSSGSVPVWWENPHALFESPSKKFLM